MLDAAKQRQSQIQDTETIPNSSVQFVDSQPVTPAVQTVEPHYAFSVTDGNQSTIRVNLGNVDIDMIIDSGASCNVVIDQATWEWLKSRKIKCTSMRTQRQLFSYGSQEPMKVIGKFMASVTVGTHCEDAEFTVVAEKGQALLERDTVNK